MRPIVGEAKQDPNNPVPFELRVENHVQRIDEDGFDPNYYFITSGDAVQKTLAMIRIIKNKIETSTDDALCEKYVARLTEAETLLELLKGIRCGACFLETEWDRNALVLIAKNPRTK